MYYTHIASAQYIGGETLGQCPHGITGPECREFVEVSWKEWGKSTQFVHIYMSIN